MDTRTQSERAMNEWGPGGVFGMISVNQIKCMLAIEAAACVQWYSSRRGLLAVCGSMGDA